MQPINGKAEPTIEMLPKGDPHVIRAAQHLLDLAREGRIIALTAVGVDPQGGTQASQALPDNSTILHLMIGALAVAASDIADRVKQQRQQAAMSPIIRPRMG
jgi:hypothetical protein